MAETTGDFSASGKVQMALRDITKPGTTVSEQELTERFRQTCEELGGVTVPGFPRQHNAMAEVELYGFPGGEYVALVKDLAQTGFYVTVSHDALWPDWLQKITEKIN